MKKFPLLSLLLLIIFSCDRGVDPSSTEYNLLNSTSCEVQVRGYYEGEIIDTYVINKNSDITKTFFSSDPGEIVYPPPFDSFIDSCVVTYCNEYNITHVAEYSQFDITKPIHSLFNEDHYEISVDKDNYFYKFEFTEEDYERAVKINSN